jgi:hypothetical protein
MILVMRTHGQSNSPTYQTWRAMRQRCALPTQRSFPYYGAGGIRVCTSWSGSFEAFVADVGPRPAGTTIGRIDHRRGYEPGNVRWMSRREQDHPHQIELPLRVETVQLRLPLERFGLQSALPSSDSPSIAPNPSVAVATTVLATLPGHGGQGI